MRILGLRFKNINSLAGEWQVDFTRPEYTADGIFAITGPTGAGKTTLLDVICLALYGRTPRLDRVNKSGNDVMTRQTGECWAEVTFSTQTGRYRCYWSQHRARKKAGAELQTPRHEISDAHSGQIIDNQIRTVEKRIEEITGMDFQRFTQSMMLAQGGFAAFLKASADERAPILEQITGTAIYSDISIKVHERHAFERTQLQLLQSELSGMQLLTPEQETALRAEEHTQSQALLPEKEQLAKLKEHLAWQRQCQDLQQKLLTLKQQQEHWQQQHNAFADQREQLHKANRALELSGHYSALTTLRQQQQADLQKELSAAHAEPGLQEQRLSLESKYNHAQAAHQQTDQKLIQMRPVFRQVHVLDSSLSQQRTQLDRLNADVCKLEGDLYAAQQQTNVLQAAVDKESQALALLSEVGETSYDDMLKRLNADVQRKQALLDKKQSELDALTEGKSPNLWRETIDQLSQTLAKTDALLQRYSERNTLLESLQSQHHQRTQAETELAELTQKQQQLQQLFGARDALVAALQKEVSLLHTIKNLESLRVQLVDGQPCQLCGSLQHPYASHAPDADVDALNTQLREALSLLNESRDQLQHANNRTLQHQEKIKHITGQCLDTLETINALELTLLTQTEALRLGADVTLAQHRDMLLAEQDAIKKTLLNIDAAQQDLTALDKAARAAHESVVVITQRITTLSHTQTRLHDSQQQLEKIKQQKSATLAERERQQQTLNELISQRQGLLGDNDADQHEAQLEAELARANGTLQTALAQYQLAEKRLDDNRQLRLTLAQQLIERAQQISADETAFNSLLNNKSFNNEADYLAAVLPDQVRQDLQQQAEQLARQGSELQALINQYTHELDDLLQAALTDQTHAQLLHAIDEQDKRVSQLQEALGGIRRDLSNNELARSKQQQQAEKIDNQKVELVRWAALHDLIGSADGKKFRNFAQGLTFEMMISHANQQLTKMTDRYQLIRDPEQPLDLNVIDYYQAGDIRSTKNLSGGESFIVSLALALGLSCMASRNVRVDSLFLDEGFGTLDEDALDTALETLGSLQQEGKLIGVISHIPALKERISTQIRVSPGTGGRSTLSGPGCSAL
ncbi:chromosome segregation protein SMC [Gammaproteobacteria bacterium LSUCC0112]|nr:chromosome segregation protein SMC [Gammaproteobacteria bacterium LSUCC0112]